MSVTESSAPADTRMMGIVHEALRRDLRRTRAVLDADAPPRAQREAVADHLVWMMQFLHSHHEGEDAGLYPAVRARNPEAGPMIDAMDAQHQSVAPAIAEVDAAARQYRVDDQDGEAKKLLAAIDDLESVLLPHLRQEEDEMMPIVAVTLTDEELTRIEDEFFVKGKSLVELGREGHWLIDDLPPDLRGVVTSAVGAVPRFVLLHGFARSYRRRSAVRWGRSARPQWRVQPTADVAVEVAAAPADVWDVATDVTRVGEWSHECQTVTWLDGATGARPGARFRGRNHAGVFRWARVCEVVSSEPWEFTWRTVPSPLYPDTTIWTIRLHETPSGGTRIEQRYEGSGPRILFRLYGILIASHRDRTAALTADLERLGEVAAQHDDRST